MPGLHYVHMNLVTPSLSIGRQFQRYWRVPQGLILARFRCGDFPRAPKDVDQLHQSHLFGWR
jgi:hypothetical protein